MGSERESKKSTELILEESTGISTTLIQEYCTFHYASCGSGRKEPFILFNCRMFLFTWTNPVDKFVLDLRNGGGSSVYSGTFHSKNDDRLEAEQNGESFCSNRSWNLLFGSSHAISLKKRTNAIFVGEPTGGSPGIMVK